MKSFVALLTMLLSTSTSAEEEVSHLRVYSKPHVEEHEVNQEALVKKQDMFYRMAHMESTPWDSKPKDRATKCKDLCMLSGFWKFQQTRNCVNRPTSLCSIYKTGIASMEVVLTVAECTCTDSS